MQRVFLLGVGAQKAGTTWLWNYLNQRTDTDMGLVKEYHVLDARFTPEITHHGAKRVAAMGELEWFHRFLPARRQAPAWRLHRMERDLDRYFDYFTGLLSDRVRLTGDITPSYSALPAHVLSLVKEGFARRGVVVKVAFLMRDPAERALSATRRHLEKYPEQCPPGTLTEVMKQMCRTPEYEARARYEKTLACIEEVFAPEDRFICLYENLFQPASIERLCASLNLPVQPANFDERVNTAGERMVLAPELRQELLSYYGETIAAVAQRLGHEEIARAWPGALACASPAPGYAQRDCAAADAACA
ncbi:MAG: hypothetical protein RL434_2747 [Pseudomonadota bacterium]